MSPPRVVVVGGGFGGLSCVRALRRAPVAITLIDRRNFHLFQPLLYQVATAALSAPQIAAPLRHVLRRQKNARVLLGEVTGVDLAGRAVLLDGGERVAYDHLVLATGVTHDYFGHDGWAAHAPGLKSLEDAMAIRHRVLGAFEAAERVDGEAREAYLTFVVVGAGPTGVELAGALAEVAHHTLAREFRRADPTRARVVLLEAGDRVLPGFPPELGAKAARQLERLGVTVRTGAAVTSVDETGVTLGTERIPSRTILWAAGIAASPLGAELGAPTDGKGRVRVEPDLSLPGHPEVYVIGDLAAVEGAPGVAPAATQGGRHAAECIRRRLAGKATDAFRYRDRGSLATIGKAAAVAAFGRLRLSGFVAWVLWLFVHIYFLIGFRNRMVVLIDWAASYLGDTRPARLMTGPRTPPITGKDPEP